MDSVWVKLLPAVQLKTELNRRNVRLSASTDAAIVEYEHVRVHKYLTSSRSESVLPQCVAARRPEALPLFDRPPSEHLRHRA
jgi:hypothetical protein